MHIHERRRIESISLTEHHDRPDNSSSVARYRISTNLRVEIFMESRVKHIVTAMNLTVRFGVCCITEVVRVGNGTAVESRVRSCFQRHDHSDRRPPPKQELSRRWNAHTKNKLAMFYAWCIVHEVHLFRTNMRHQETVIYVKLL